MLLRDPVERYRSGMAHLRSRGVRISPALADQHFARGLYWNQLMRLLACFDRNRILLLQYERCVASPLDEWRRTNEFLGLEPPSEAPELLTRVVNPTAGDKPVLPPAAAAVLRHAYREDIRRLARDFPELDMYLWPTTAG